MANRRCFHALARHWSPFLSSSPIRTIKSYYTHPLYTSQSLQCENLLSSPHQRLRRYDPLNLVIPKILRHFSSKRTSDDDEEDEGEEDEEEEDEEEEDDGDDGESEHDEGDNDSVSKCIVKRANSEMDKEEAAAIGYQVIGPLDPSDRPFKPWEPVFAIVQIGSHQFKVSNGDSIFTERLKYCEVNDKSMDGLKYLDFVQVAAFNAVVCFSRFYDFAKENSGPLKPGVQTVEGTVKIVIGPVYEKFHDVPIEMLKYVDRKVDNSVHELERHVPSVVKEVSSQTFSAAQKAPGVARAVASEVQRAGVVETATGFAKTVYAKCEPAAKDLYTKYEPVAEGYAVSAWRTLNRLPLFPQVAQVVLPSASYWSEKYNQTVCYTAERGYTVSTYLPLVPTKKLAKVFGGEGDEPLSATRTVENVPTGEQAAE